MHQITHFETHKLKHFCGEGDTPFPYLTLILLAPGGTSVVSHRPAEVYGPDNKLVLLDIFQDNLCKIISHSPSPLSPAQV